MTVILNLTIIDFDTQFGSELASHYVSILLGCALLVAIISTFYFVNRNFKHVNKERFQDKYGALLDGTKTDVKEPNRSIIVYPLIFFLRRFAFSISAIYLSDVLWG